MAKYRWKQKDFDCTNGNRTLEIGDEIAYVATGTEYNGKWLLLGINDNGKALLISEKSVTSQMLSGKRGYDRGVKILNRICKRYSKGKGAIRARCINVLDIYRIQCIQNKAIQNERHYDAYERCLKVIKKFSELNLYWLAKPYRNEWNYKDKISKIFFGICAANDSPFIYYENALFEQDKFSYEKVEYTYTYGVRPIVEVNLDKLFKS